MLSAGTRHRSFSVRFRDVLKENVPLAPYTSLRLGGPSKYYAEPRSVEELGALVRHCREHAIPLKLLGGGTNCLIPDEGFAGLVIRLTDPAFACLSISSEGVTCGAGLKLSKALAVTTRSGLGGLEKLAGIPGTLGGALCGNAGTQLGDMGSMVSAVAVLGLDFRPAWRAGNEVAFGYRESNLRENILLACKLNLVEEDPAQLAQRGLELGRQKRTSQPYARRSAGCVFKNPHGASAGALIDRAGLKGARIGGAQVSELHANFFIADRGATSGDVLRLMDHVRDIVRKKFDVALEAEIDIW